LILINLSGNGRIRLLYPRVEADPPLITESDFDLSLQVAEPFGSDHLIAIVSDRRLDQVESAAVAIDGQKPGELVDILRRLRLSDHHIRFGMAASFTAP
jgi:hypothetical protein